MSGDLYFTARGIDEQVGDRTAVDLQTERGDLRLVRGRASLAQSILNRLLTRQRELTDLGHPDYGSRLYQLVGEPNTRRTQVIAELYIRESLAMEERVQEITSIQFAPFSIRADKRNMLEIYIEVLPVNETEPLGVRLALGG